MLQSQELLSGAIGVIYLDWKTECKGGEVRADLERREGIGDQQGNPPWPSVESS